MRIAARTPVGINPTAEMQVISDTLDLLALADQVEAMEERLRPSTWRERRGARRMRRMMGCARRVFGVSATVAQG